VGVCERKRGKCFKLWAMERHRKTHTIQCVSLHNTDKIDKVTRMGAFATLKENASVFRTRWIRLSRTTSTHSKKDKQFCLSFLLVSQFERKTNNFTLFFILILNVMFYSYNFENYSEHRLGFDLIQSTLNLHLNSNHLL